LLQIRRTMNSEAIDKRVDFFIVILLSVKPTPWSAPA
jgi:hypothetical protein